MALESFPYSTVEIEEKNEGNELTNWNKNDYEVLEVFFYFFICCEDDLARV